MAEKVYNFFEAKILRVNEIVTQKKCGNNPKSNKSSKFRISFVFCANDDKRIECRIGAVISRSQKWRKTHVTNDKREKLFFELFFFVERKKAVSIT